MDQEKPIFQQVHILVGLTKPSPICGPSRVWKVSPLCNFNPVAINEFIPPIYRVTQMGSNLADLPLKLLMPSSFDNTREIAFKTIRSASKADIRTVLQSMYGLEIEKVRTLNMQGKKKMRAGRLVASPNYKKAYITLKIPISISYDFCPADATRRTNQADKGVERKA